MASRSILSSTSLDFQNDSATRVKMVASYATDTSVMTLEGKSSGRVRLTGLAPPVNPSDALTLQYYESAKEGLDVRESVKLAIATDLTTGYTSTETYIQKDTNGAIGSTFQSYTLGLDDRVLLTNQSDSSENGIYYVSVPGSAATQFRLTRAPDMIDSSQVEGGLFTFVEGGTYANQGWVLSGTHYTTSSGSLTVVNGSTDVTGSGTSFTSFKAGQAIEFSGHKYLVSSITDDTNLVISTASLVTGSSLAFKVGPKFAMTSAQLDGSSNDNLTFTRFSGAGLITVSSPLTKSGDVISISDGAISNAKLANSSLSVVAGDGLSTTAASIDLGGTSTLSLNVDSSTVEIASDTLQVKDSGITNAKLANPSLTVTAGDGLSTTSASIALGASASLSVNVDDSTIETSSDALQVKAGGLTNSHINASAAIAISKLAASTISGKSLGTNLDAHTIGVGSASLTLTNSGSTFNGSATVSHVFDTAQNIQTTASPSFAGLSITAGDIAVTKNSTDGGRIGFAEASGNGTSKAFVQAPATIAGDYTLTLPTNAGTLVATGDSGSITNGMIASGTIENDRMASATVSVVGGSGLSTTSSTISLGNSATMSVNVDDSSLEVHTDDNLRVKALGVTNAMLAGSIDNSKLSNNTIGFTMGNAGISRSSATTALGASQTLSLVVDDSTVEVDATNGAQLKAGGITDTHVNASAAIAISKLAASTISGKSLGTALDAHTISVGSNGLTLTNSGTTFNGSAAVSHQIELPQSLVTTASPSFAALTCTGQVSGSQFLSTSDARLKTNIEEIEDPISMLSNLKSYRYSWDSKACEEANMAFRPGTEIGLMAQDVSQDLPELTGRTPNGYLAVDYSRLTALLVGCVRKQQSQIDRLEAMLHE